MARALATKKVTQSSKAKAAMVGTPEGKKQKNAQNAEAGEKRNFIDKTKKIAGDKSRRARQGEYTSEMEDFLRRENPNVDLGPLDKATIYEMVNIYLREMGQLIESLKMARSQRAAFMQTAQDICYFFHVNQQYDLAFRDSIVGKLYDRVRTIDAEIFWLTGKIQNWNGISRFHDECAQAFWRPWE